MYAIFAAEPYKEQAVINQFRRHGQLLYLFRIPGGDLNYDFEVWELEFEACDRFLVAAMLRGLDTWGTNSSVIAELLETDCEELRAVVTAPIPEQPSITWCVRRYLSYHPDYWRDYWSAMGPCDIVSRDFLSFLRRYNAVSSGQMTSGYAGVSIHYMGDKRYASADFPTEIHAVTKIGRLRVDFTRRQFVRDAPVPTVWISTGKDDDVFPPRRSKRS